MEVIKLYENRFKHIVLNIEMMKTPFVDELMQIVIFFGEVRKPQEYKEYYEEVRTAFMNEKIVELMCFHYQNEELPKIVIEMFEFKAEVKFVELISKNEKKFTLFDLSMNE